MPGSRARQPTSTGRRLQSNSLPMSESTRRHKSLAKRQGPVRVALVTVSDTRKPSNDANRRFLEAELVRAGHEMVDYRLIADDPVAVALALDGIAEGQAQVQIWNGGTGIAPRDTTFDVLQRRLEKVLPGFGELFRALSYEQVGSAAMLSRAVAGVYQGQVVISLPGSPAAVRLAWDKLIAPELSHLAWEVARGS